MKTYKNEEAVLNLSAGKLWVMHASLKDGWSRMLQKPLPKGYAAIKQLKNSLFGYQVLTNS